MQISRCCCMNDPTVFLQAITITVDETQHNMTQQMGKQWHIQQNIQSL